MALGSLWTLGLILILSGEAWLTAVGVGLWFPGGGFLVGHHGWLAAPALVLAGWSAARVVGRGDHVTPVAVHLGLALAAGLLAHGARHLWPLVAVPLLLMLVCARASLRRRRAVRAARVQAARPLIVRPRRDRPPGRVLDASDLAVQRWLLDRALQPVTSWEGFDQRDQYSLRSLRYQLNWQQWALALAQSEATPAFDGYTRVAQQQLVDRMTDSRVWSYWSRENVWGNLATSGDPVARDNVMFSGYLLAMLGAYRSSTGDVRYDLPDAVAFEGRHGPWHYEHASVAAAVARNLDASPTSAFPCEPGMVFPLCNAVAMAGVALRDPGAAAALWPRHHARLVEEHTFPDGLVPFFQWTRGGVAPYGARDVAGTAVVAFFLSAVDQGFAERAWDRMRDQALDTVRAEAPCGSDWGTGRRSSVTPLAFTAMLAGAVGDAETHGLALDRAADLLQLRTEAGAAAYESASVTGNAMLAVARFSSSGAWARLAAPRPAAGPQLVDIAYPDVLVHAARTDGERLHLQLSSGESHGSRRIGLAGLVPGREHAVVSGTASWQFLADTTGRAAVELPLERTATAFEVGPVSSSLTLATS